MSRRPLPASLDASLARLDALRLDPSRFGAASPCRSMDDAIRLVSVAADPTTRARAAAMAMVFAVVGRTGVTYAELQAAQRALIAAKAQIDAASGQDPAVADTTKAILGAAEGFVRDTSTPPTEWPTVRELVGCVLEAADGAAPLPRPPR